MGRQRLGSDPLVALYDLIVKPLATSQFPGAFYRGMRKVAIDGTILDVPDCDKRLGDSPLVCSCVFRVIWKDLGTVP
jgi:hypothetical protein